MTISYDEDFSSVMLRWKGSLWKAVLKDLIVFYVLFYLILFCQWYFLNDEQKVYFTGWIKWCEIGSEYIPLSFLLGFYVAVVVARWWEQFNWISWPDKLMMMIAACFPGEENLVLRETVCRWSSLQAVICWRMISVRTLKRFPTLHHLVDSSLMTNEEYQMYMDLDAPHGKWFVPTMWIINIIKREYAKKKIDTIQLDMLLKQVYAYREGFAMLLVYDWVKIPLVYTQVVAIATYGYFSICLLGRQPKLDPESMSKEVTILFPVFTTFQLLFYLGWLKVGQYLVNPFGEDDDDFELNYILDRNTYVAKMMASPLADQLPPIRKPHMGMLIPHTLASFKIQDVIPRGHLEDFKLSDSDMRLITPEEAGEQAMQLYIKKRKSHFRTIAAIFGRFKRSSVPRLQRQVNNPLTNSEDVQSTREAADLTMCDKP
ncbi:hypothetical protein AB6A40_007574 [Gnathostoma spinigerum]|uniref:Bestrophin homolog n=1 Tax=Gnathostoma spinigerum TaxID=75299 RepID=A0ABD6EX78_9BILA